MVGQARAPTLEGRVAGADCFHAARRKGLVKFCFATTGRRRAIPGTWPTPNSSPTSLPSPAHRRFLTCLQVKHLMLCCYSLTTLRAPLYFCWPAYCHVDRYMNMWSQRSNLFIQRKRDHTCGKTLRIFRDADACEPGDQSCRDKFTICGLENM